MARFMDQDGNLLDEVVVSLWLTGTIPWELAEIVVSDGATYIGVHAAGGMEKLSKTTGGLWSTVTGNLKTVLANIGTGLIEAFNVKPILEWAGATLDSVALWASKMGEFVIFLRENWRLALAIMVERARLFVLNTWEQINLIQLKC